MKFLQRPLTLTFQIRHVLVLLAFTCIAMFLLTACWGTQTSASTDNATTAGDKWGLKPNIKNFFEYHQLKEIYEARDNPKLVLNAYLFSQTTGQFTCLGTVVGYGVPYGTQWSQPVSATGGSVPEPNALYPSTNTNADWIRIVDNKGNQHLTFAEPDLVITDMDYPCIELHK